MSSISKNKTNPCSPSLNLNPIKSILERDIDLLLLEELSINPEFQEWFASRIFEEVIFQTSLEVLHSVSSDLGETDILYLFESTDGSRIALLIENKIDAPPQPDQSARYRLRGEAGQRDGYWEEFKTCVLAPTKYLSTTNQTQSYDAEISYEEIFSFFQSRSSRSQRFAYKANIILEGIHKNRRGYQPIYDKPNTQFVQDYYDYVNPLYPELNMQKPKPRPSGSTWITFYPESFTERIDLMHQVTAGKVKLLIYALPEEHETIKARYEPNIPEDAVVESLAKSVSISFHIEPLNPFEFSYNDQILKVKKAVKKILELKMIVEKTQ